MATDERARLHRRGKVWIAAAALPLLWMAQGTLGWFLAAHACPASMRTLRFGTARLAIGLASVLLIALGGAGLAAAYAVWRALTSGSGARGGPPAVVERVRFVATLGLVVCVTLTLGGLLAGLPTLFLHACGETR